MTYKSGKSPQNQPHTVAEIEDLSPIAVILHAERCMNSYAVITEPLLQAVLFYEFFAIIYIADCLLRLFDEPVLQKEAHEL